MKFFYYLIEYTRIFAHEVLPVTKKKRKCKGLNSPYEV
jgi:hypothetical protein